MFQIFIDILVWSIVANESLPSGPSGLSAGLLSLDLASCTILSCVEYAALNVLIAFLKVSASSKSKCL